MSRQFVLCVSLATLSAAALALSAQSPDPTVPNTPPAPIERTTLTPYGSYSYTTKFTTGQDLSTTHGTAGAQPAPGIILRLGHDTSLHAVVVSPQNIELKVDHGLANISVHHPAGSPQILVDLPGGQIALLKDGLYTVNAATNTVRVLKGEALAFPPNQKEIKIKEDHAAVLDGPGVHSFEFEPYQARVDLIPYVPARGQANRGPVYRYAPFAYGDPLAFYEESYGYPYDYGYTGFYPYPFGVGLGLGLYGGGFHGRR